MQNISHLPFDFEHFALRIWHLAGKTFSSCQYLNARQAKAIRVQKTIDSHLSALPSSQGNQEINLEKSENVKPVPPKIFKCEK